MRADMERRAEVLAQSLQEIVQPAMAKRSKDQLRSIVDRFGNRQQLAGLIVYDQQGQVLAESPNITSHITPPQVPLEKVKTEPAGLSQFFRARGQEMEVYYLPLLNETGVSGILALFYDASYIEAQSKDRK